MPESVEQIIERERIDEVHRSYRRTLREISLAVRRVRLGLQLPEDALKEIRKLVLTRLGERG